VVTNKLKHESGLPDSEFAIWLVIGSKVSPFWAFCRYRFGLGTF